jgi:hypothetical protein
MASPTNVIAITLNFPHPVLTLHGISISDPTFAIIKVAPKLQLNANAAYDIP